MKLIVGLGNPGEKYENTPHNLGFTVVDRLQEKMKVESGIKSGWEKNKKFSADTYKYGGLVLVKPMTFMNKSGESVGKIADYYRIDSEDIWVIHDDLDLSFGQLRIRQGGGSGGHHGVESILNHFDSGKVVRFKMGIAGEREVQRSTIPKEIKDSMVTSFVLSKVKDDNIINEFADRCCGAITFSLENGLMPAMNKFNQ